MAIDSAAKRYSAMNPLSPWRQLAVVPSGTIAVEDRAAVLFLYGGLAVETAVDPPVITPDTLSDGYDTYPYSVQLQATGDPVDTWAVTVGVLPDGLSLDAGTGAITGTPTTEETQAFTVEATNAAGSDTEDFEITILAASAYPVGTGARMRMRSLGLINRR